MGAKQPHIYRLKCEFCGNCHDLYMVEHTHPVCSDFIVCELHIDAAKEMIEFEEAHA